MKARADIFSTLFRWAYRQGENYTTESLVWLLNYLLESENPVARRLIAAICFGESQENALRSSPIHVTTQDVTEQGRPDIRVESKDFLSFIEVKTDSELGNGQIERYLKEVKKQANGRRASVCLLTTWPVEPSEGELQPDHHIRWHRVADWLDKNQPSLTRETSRFLVSEFLRFMKEQGMTIEHVGCEYSSGVIAMSRLLDMLSIAIEHAKVKASTLSAARNWIGCCLGENKDWWIGFTFDTPNRLRVSRWGPKVGKQKFDQLCQEGGSPLVKREWNKGRPKFVLQLDDEHIRFFALTKESQLELLTRFVAEAYKEARACEIE